MFFKFMHKISQSNHNLSRENVFIHDFGTA